MAEARLNAVVGAKKELGGAPDQANEVKAALTDTTCPGLVTDGGAGTPLMGWGLMVAYKGEHGADPPLKGSSVVSAHHHFLSKAGELFKVQCRVCWGYGHTKDYCATLPRLKAATGSDRQVGAWLGKAVGRGYLGVRPDVGAPNGLGELASLAYKVPEGFLDKHGQVKRGALRY